MTEALAVRTVPARGRPALRLAALLRMALRDLWHERTLALCTACVLAATLSPLWVLWGLERGVIGTLIERMERDPLMRRITPAATGNNRFDAAWIERVRTWPEVAFVIPTVRYSASLVDLYSPDAAMPLSTELFESAPADPLLAGARPPSGRSLVLSAAAAERLKARPGQTLRLSLGRERDGVTERAVVEVTVADVLPRSAGTRESALVPQAVLAAIEAWRDGYVVPGFGEAGSGAPPLREVHARFRLHTHSIRQVEDVARRLASEGVATDVDSPQIAATLGLQRNLQSVLALVAGVTVAGAVVALSALQVAAVRRKRREYALLKLTGHGRSWLVAMPCLSAAAVAVLGAALGLAVHGLAAWAINGHFASHLADGERAVRLGGSEMGIGLAAALVVSLVPALVAGWRASKVEAADELREP
jgi:putative ABC transport system permease protein